MMARRKYKYTVQYTGKLKKGGVVTRQINKTFKTRESAQSEAFRARIAFRKKKIKNIMARKVPLDARYDTKKRKWK